MEAALEKIIDKLIDKSRYLYEEFGSNYYKNVLMSLKALKAASVLIPMLEDKIAELEDKLSEIHNQDPIGYMVRDKFFRDLSAAEGYADYLTENYENVSVIPVYNIKKSICITKNKDSQVATDNSKALANALKKIDELEKKQQWQPVENHPDESILEGGCGYFLTLGSCEFGWPSVRHYNKTFSHRNNGWNDYLVTHWMPLPLPPTDNQDE